MAGSNRPKHAYTAVGEEFAGYLGIPHPDKMAFREGETVFKPLKPVVPLPKEWVGYFFEFARYSAWCRWANLDDKVKFRRLAKALRSEHNRNHGRIAHTLDPNELHMFFIQELAAMFGVTEETVKGMIKAGRLDGIVLPEAPGGYIVTIQALMEFFILEGSRHKRLSEIEKRRKNQQDKLAKILNKKAKE